MKFKRGKRDREVSFRNETERFSFAPSFSRDIDVAKKCYHNISIRALPPRNQQQGYCVLEYFVNASNVEKRKIGMIKKYNMSINN